MVLTTEQRYVAMFLFRKKLDGRSATKEINEVYGAKTVSEQSITAWFRRFRGGDFSINDKPKSGRPSTFNDDALIKLVEKEPKTSVRELAFLLQESPSTVFRHLIALGKVRFHLTLF